MKKNFLLTSLLSFTSLIPGLSIIACSDKTTNNNTANENGKNKQGVIASFISHADILLGMGIKPDYLAIKGMGIKTDYLNNKTNNNAINDVKVVDYINTFPTLDPVMMKMLAEKAKIIITSFGKDKLKEYFDNVLQTETASPYSGTEEEKLTWTFSDSGDVEIDNKYGKVQYSGRRDFSSVNIYANWQLIADGMDKLISQKDKDTSNDHQFRKNVDKTIKVTKDRIKAIRTEVAKLANKNLLVYKWGEKTSPSGPNPSTEFSSDEVFQTLDVSGTPLGTLLFSKKYGLGFDITHFNTNSDVVVSKAGYPDIKGIKNGLTDVKTALNNANDYVLFGKQLYKGEDEATVLGKIKNSDIKAFVKDSDKNDTKFDTNFWWFNHGTIDNESYGPYGVNDILNFIIDKLNLNISKDFNFGISAAVTV